MEKKLNVCIDFDGVLNTYKGWKGEKHLYTPIEGVHEFLEELHEKYNVIILSTRNPNDISIWLYRYALLDFIDEITEKKPKAIAYIDDRAINFDGDFNKVLRILDSFKTHWE